jgi:hypothetical protein
LTQGQEIILPGEKKTYTFSFYATLPGQFFAKYIIETNPTMAEPLAQIELSGYSVIEDANLEK